MVVFSNIVSRISDFLIQVSAVSIFVSIFDKTLEAFL